MTAIINASTSSGITMTADNSGVMKLQSNGVTTNALAWVNFNGTGTVAIRSSYNVSSITDNGTGDYTINFTNALTDANYSAVVGGKIDETGGWGSLVGIARTANSITTTSLRVTTANSAFSLYDYLVVNVAIFGN